MVKRLRVFPRSFDDGKQYNINTHGSVVLAGTSTDYYTAGVGTAISTSFATWGDLVVIIAPISTSVSTLLLEDSVDRLLLEDGVSYLIIV